MQQLPMTRAAPIANKNKYYYYITLLLLFISNYLIAADMKIVTKQTLVAPTVHTAPDGATYHHTLATKVFVSSELKHDRQCQ
jgi:hypothetical protein